MEVIYFMIPVALALGGLFVVGFIQMVRSGQYEDLETPAIRMLEEEEETK